MIFPEDTTMETEDSAELPDIEDIAVDFAANRLLLRDGRNYRISGEAALRQWIYKALKTARNIYGAYTGQFGEEFAPGDSAEALEAEIRDTLTVSPYISGVGNITMGKSGSRATAAFFVETVYGALEMEVDI